ncbi:MAG: aminobenzoyl-glutamate transport protein [Bacillota bacterium]|nr:aminobenzoyl-glutamate transport protein [Bacillota bacterium]
MPEKKQSDELGGWFGKFINWVEAVGNRLPHPFTLFVILALVTLALSWILASAGVEVTYMKPPAKVGEAPQQVTVAVQNLLAFGPMRKFMADFVKNFVAFPPLGLILTMMLGIALLDQTGFMSAAMRKTILGAPPALVTMALAFVGINSNLASDAGSVFTAAIGGSLFAALGRNPLVGVVTGYAAGWSGFTANLMIAGTDALLSGITAPVAQAMGITAPTHPMINWFFMIVATFTLTLGTTYVTERFTAKRLGDTRSQGRLDENVLQEHALKPEEERGLRWALGGFLLFVAIMLILSLPPGAFFRNPEGAFLPKSPLTDSIMAILFFFFLFVGVGYGIGAGTIKSEKDVPRYMAKGIEGIVGFIVVALPAALFIYLFNSSNITTVLAVKGAEFLKAMNLGGIPLALMFILLVAFINLFIVSGSSKWIILAPIFLPMFSVVSFSPALTQVAYRIGDTATNIISPLSPYIPVILGLLTQFNPKKEEVGIGTYISLMIPYSIAYLIILSIQIVIWMLLKLPLGPGAGIYL